MSRPKRIEEVPQCEIAKMLSQCWINVKDVPIPDNKAVLISYSGVIRLGYKEPHHDAVNSVFLHCNILIMLEAVTHWMPLPDLPNAKA